MNHKRVSHSEQKSENINIIMKITKNSNIPRIMSHEKTLTCSICVRLRFFLSQNSKNDDKSTFLEILGGGDPKVLLHS